jgi:hypothetical protein
MSFAGMNYVAIVVAALASFGFGSVYYMTMASPWLEAVGKTKEDLKPSPTPFVVAIAANLVMAWMLHGVMSHLGPGQLSIKNGMITAAFLWLGFVITSMAVNNCFAGRPGKLTAIDGIHWLAVLVIQGAVIGAFGAGAP